MVEESALKITDENFEGEVIKSNIPVLVDFWASWCGPCKMIGPIVEELAREYTGRVKVAKMNVDENMETPNEYNVRSIPTLVLFKDGEEIDRMVGANSKSSLQDMIKKAFAAS